MITMANTTRALPQTSPQTSPPVTCVFVQNRYDVEEDLKYDFDPILLKQIRAPPGMLGFSIDTPDDGPPVINNVKSTSILVNHLKVGDRIILVDGIDVRDYTAMQVSRIIHEHREQRCRKIMIHRSEFEV